MRAMVTYDIELNGRLYQVLIPNGSPFDDARAVLSEVIEELNKEQALLLAKAAEQAAQQEQAAPSQEQTTTETV